MDFLIRPAKVQDYLEILRLNEADVEMLSPMDEDMLFRMAFHRKMGFHEVGTKPFKGTITVSLQVKAI